MLIQSTSRDTRPFSRTQQIARTIRAKELMPMCIIRLEDSHDNPSMLELSLRCKRALTADLSPELEVVFVGLNATAQASLTEWRTKYHLHTLGDWTRALRTLLAPGSEHCPNCGLKTFGDPDAVVIFCEACGANPGQVFERAGGVTNVLTT